MSVPLPEDQLRNLKIFIELLKKDPNVLQHPDLEFFRSYIVSLGGHIPPRKGSGDEPIGEKNQENELEVEDVESEVELDYEGVIEPDNDPPQVMGYLNEEKVSEEHMKMSDEKKREAMELYSEEKFEDAVAAYTEAILLHPLSALLYAKRGQCYLQLKKPNACIRDCNRALEINPDYAAAYKFRGRAHRLLGNFVKAAEDLRNACKIDYDEQADEWLKEVTPNARKLEEHQRKYERKRLEKEVKETRERIKKMREEQQKRASGMENNSNESEEEVEGADSVGGTGGAGGAGVAGGAGGVGGVGGVGGFGGFGGPMGDCLKLMKDPDFVQALLDPEVAQAFQDMSKNPINLMKYLKNPKITAVLEKLGAKYAGKMPTGGVPTGVPGAAKSPPSNDMDLD